MSKALDSHREWQGKIEVISRVKVDTREALSLAYTPGVAEPCLEIARDENLAYEYTRKGKIVAVITDGSAVLGLGNIGASASMPVMEGKCALFKEFGGVDAFPICVHNQSVESIVNTIADISKSFGGINLEDISAPRCFEVEERLKEMLPIPVFHDDQHGTAIVVCAALINALKLAGKKWSDVKIVVVGAGAAGTAITKLLLHYNPKDIIMCDKKGIIHAYEEWLNPYQRIMAGLTNNSNLRGELSIAMVGADVVIGVSGPNTIAESMVASMADKSIVFAMCNPTPEIAPDIAKLAGAYIVGTGRSDYANQINNVLVFPGIFKGALDAHATKITEGMKMAAVQALVDLVGDNLSKEYILPKAFDPAVATCVAKAVADTAIREGVIRS